MPFLSFATQTGLCAHRCATCQHVQQALPLDAVQGRVTLRGENLVVACPACGAEEHHRLDHAPWEEGTPPTSAPTPQGMGTNPLDFGPQPAGSLVGTALPLDNGLFGRITQHMVGWHTTGERARHIRLLRQIARHPALQAQLPTPLRERIRQMD